MVCQFLGTLFLIRLLSAPLFSGYLGGKLFKSKMQIFCYVDV
ncbi:hypothetical protein PTRA_a2952 [Pseudoalteromonas translucida KMM 520]|uniref:Uncharacterized protein n=1 Tax=Pseudoalteromonas translucida KMM 520 TaxID=1315283 RepID=A0A0U2MRC3_9GAMM|nr:hypothetical protein PTRA_a2952 [Pseudoalteromonas translucida KMM 520]